MKQILNRYTGDVILEVQGNSLSGANLCGTDLRYADLRYAKLTGATIQLGDTVVMLS